MINPEERRRQRAIAIEVANHVFNKNRLQAIASANPSKKWIEKAKAQFHYNKQLKKLGVDNDILK